MSNPPGYESMRFGDEDNDGLPALHPTILKTVQNIYRELAKDEHPPLALDNWHHSALLSYELDPTRFCLVTDGGAAHRGYLEDCFGGKPERVAVNIDAEFQPVRDWVRADINARGLNRPTAVAARAAAKTRKAQATAKDWEDRLKIFYQRAGIDGPVPPAPNRQKRCPKSTWDLQSCAGCRIVCCVKPECVSGVDGATGCMKHPHTVYCLACRAKAPGKNIPELMECPDYCKRTYCRADFSWCIGRLSSEDQDNTDVPSDSTTRAHGPKPVMCPKHCSFARTCCNPRCWSAENGPIDGMAPRAVCLDCGKGGQYCAGKHLWLCEECVAIAPPADTSLKKAKPFASAADRILMIDDDEEIDESWSSICEKCALWMCESCEETEGQGSDVEDFETY
ncbi:hypothetical protein DFH07DRAFT_973197 [Mycena maculata]|uniref:Uncharacterized protein n=1 Tax=Mycena maculata TaxID=230809 RepID=A0AAD7HF01_9AGAR|nr:hypothetical protein DFH07DRAFT_973197 [Mycena maculata]